MRGISSRRKLHSLLAVTAGAVGIYAGICIKTNDEKFYKNVVMPVVHLLDPERAHRLGILISKFRLIPKSKYTDSDRLTVELFGKTFSNPIGLAAGFDKNGESILGLSDLGFGFIEIGSVTPKPQTGNEKPRVFRLSKDEGVINRYGFNNDGHEHIFERVNSIRKSKQFQNILGVNLGKNKTSEDAIKDYVLGIEKFGPVADYLVINVSSPNTPGLRSMQNKETLTNLLKATITARDNLQMDSKNKPPLFLKLSPDLSPEERVDIVKVIGSKQCKVDGLIISNTTVERPESLQSVHFLKESGGLSGRPLKDPSTELIREMYALTKGTIPIIGVGGISDGQDAYEKIRAGATLIQIYTSLVYEGPPIVDKIKKELDQILQDDGLNNVCEAVGKDHHFRR